MESFDGVPKIGGIKIPYKPLKNVEFCMAHLQYDCTTDCTRLKIQKPFQRWLSTPDSPSKYATSHSPFMAETKR